MRLGELVQANKKNLDGFNFWARKDPIHHDYWKCYVETPKGRSYWISWRSDTEPTAEEIRDTWLNPKYRRTFQPG